MRDDLLVGHAALILFLFFHPQVRAVGPASPHVPLSFEQNVGQFDTPVRYVARAGSMAAFLARSGATLAIPSGSVRLAWAGANPHSLVAGEGLLPGKSNYFSANRRQTNIPNFARVRYKDLYPGIDLVFRAGDEGLEYDLVLAAGADPAQIALRFLGADKIAIDADGGLVLSVGDETIRQHTPRTYHYVAGSVRTVSSEYVLHKDGTVAVRLGDYDRNHPLVIDPVLSFSTRLGGVYGDVNADAAYGVAVDDAGGAYVTGAIASLDFPTTPGAYSRNRQPGGNCSPGSVTMLCSDVFVTKFDRTGSLVYSTYLGGADIDIGYGIAVDSGGNAFVTGSTRSHDFPTVPGALRTTPGGGTCSTYPGHLPVPCEDAFVVKLNPAGSGLVYSTFLGGAGPDQGRGIAVHRDGSATVGGWMGSGDFPFTNALRENGGVVGAFIARLDASGSRLAYATYFGPASAAYGVALDAAGNGYLTGYTATSDFPTTPGASQASGGTDAFVAKVSPVGSLHYSARIGGSGASFSQGIAVDSEGNSYITGFTDSKEYPVTNAAFAGKGSLTDAFLTKLDASGSSVVYSLRLGGNNTTQAYGISLDQFRNAYVFGQTWAWDFPLTRGAVRPCRNKSWNSTFVAEVDATGKQLLYSTYFGGTGEDSASAIAVDGLGGIWLAGSTRSSDFPTAVPAPELGYRRAAFVSKIDLTRSEDLTVSCIASGAGLDMGSVSPGEIVALFGSGIGPQTPGWLRLNEEGLVDTAISGVRVWFDDLAAPLIYVQSEQVNAVVPYEVQGKRATQIQVEYLGRKGPPTTVAVAAVRPAMFTTTMTGSGQGAILNQDGSVNSSANPAVEGSVIAIYATGFGQTDPPGVDGKINSLPYPKPILPVRVLINSKEAEVQYAGAAPGYVAGAFQVNARVPAGANDGSEPAKQVWLIVGNSTYSWPVEVYLK